MIKFENNIDFSIVLKRTQEYFDKKEYVSMLKYVGRFCVDCPNYIKAELLQKVACVYEQWGCDDKAITTLKLACMFDEKSLEAYYLLAKILLKNKNHLGFQQAFFKIGALDFNNEYIGEFLNELHNEREQTDFKLVTEESKRNDRFLDCLEAIMNLDTKEAFKQLSEFLQLYPYDRDAGELYVEQCLSLNYFSKAESFVDEWIKIQPNDAIAISNYILIKCLGEEYDLTKYIDKLSKIKLENMHTLKSAIRVFDMTNKYEQAIEVIDNFAIENDLQNNYDILTMKAVAFFNKGDIEQAQHLAKYIEVLYGQVGLGELYSFIFKQKDIVGMNMFIEYMPLGENEEMFDVFEQLFKEKDRTKLLKNVTIYVKYALVNGALFDINVFRQLCKKIYSEKFAREIMIFLNIHTDIPQFIKAQLIKVFIDFGMRDFFFFNAGNVEKVKYETIIEMQDFPKCYEDAYKLAFAYCGLNSITDTNDLLINSTMQLLDIMRKDKRKFSNVTALAGAILCNTYMLVGTNIIGTVAELLQIRPKVIENCIKTIREYGAFFDLDQDEAAMEYIQNIVSKFGDIDILE